MLIPAVLKKFVAFSDTESSRYALGAIKFKRKGLDCSATATDGRRMIQLDWSVTANLEPNTDLTGDYDKMLSGPSFAGATKVADAVIKTQDRNLRDANSTVPYFLDEKTNGLAALGYKGPGASSALEVVEGRYPDTDQCWPAVDGDVATVEVNAVFLKEIADAAMALHGNKGTPARVMLVISRDANKPLLALAVKQDYAGVGAIKMKAVVMPLARD